MLNETNKITHPLFRHQMVSLPSTGKLKWLGGNLGLDCPVRENVIDDQGQWLTMDLESVLRRLDDFEGYRGNVTMKVDILNRCFIAYQYNQLSHDEKITFEDYVRQTINRITPFDAAQATLLNSLLTT